MTSIILNGPVHDEQKFRQRMSAARGQVGPAFKLLAEAHSQGEIDQKALKKAEFEYMEGVAAKRRALLEERKISIDSQLLDYQHQLAGSKDSSSGLDKFRSYYEKLQDQDKASIEKNYKTSLKLNDEIAARAAAVVSVEKDINSVYKDYSARDPEWEKTLLEYARFADRFTSEEGRITDQLDHYRPVSQPTRKIDYVHSGYVQGPAGNLQAHYKQKISYKGEG